MASQSLGSPARLPTSVAGPKNTPVKVFAAFGVLISCVFVYALAQWVMSDDFAPSPVGPDPIPDWLLNLIRFTEVFCAGLIAWFLWALLFKPWIRDKKMPWDGMLLLALFTMWVQDPMCNYFNFTFMYNAHFINMGSWSSYLPGWQSPRGSNLPEPIFLMGGIYLWWTTINVIAFSWSLKKLRVWLPNMSTLGHIPIAFVSIVILDALLEIPATRFGLFAYPGAPYSLTLWAGKYYQFPIYENIFMNFNYLSIGLLRYYRDDKGESLAERGVGAMKIPDAAKTWLRFFALVGFCNISYFIVYFLPYNWMAMQADTFPPYPSYMRYEICGEGTPYACPSREVPVPSRESNAVIGPNDPRLSDTARQN
jgi:Spirocyclase AveC-like